MVLDGDPYEVGGRAGKARLLVALVRRGRLSAVVGFDVQALTVVGHITWAVIVDESGGQAAEVRDTHVRVDRTERGVGLALCEAARTLAGVNDWTGALIPDSSEDDSWPGDAGSIDSRRPSPVVQLTDDAPAESATVDPEVHLVLHWEGRAVIVAFAAHDLAWLGHLSWTINRPGGRLGGEEAGRAVGEIQRVDTRERFGRRGIARRMYQQAQQVASAQGWPAEIDHNPSRTADGDRWAERVGGWRPALTDGRLRADSDDVTRMFDPAATEQPEDPPQAPTA